MKILIISILALALLNTAQAQPKEYGLICMNKVSDDLVVVAKVASNDKEAYLQTSKFHIKKGYTDSFEFYRLQLSDNSIKDMFLYDIGNTVFGLQVYRINADAILLYKKTEYGDCRVLNSKEIDKFVNEGKAQTAIKN